MSACVVCGRACTPMADYEQPVCLRCDAEHGEILAAAALTAAAAPTHFVTVGAPPRRARPVGRVVVHPDLTRPVESYYGPAAPEVIEQLVDVLFPRDRATTGRRSA